MTDEFETQDELEISGSADIIYALATAPGFVPGTQGKAFAARGSGLYRSEDGGKTWSYALESLGLAEPLACTSIVLSPAFDRDGYLLAGLPGGAVRSTDGGQTYRPILLPEPPPTVSSLAISPAFAEDETMFAGTVEDGVFISRDSGVQWVAWNFGLLDLNVMCLAISPAFASDETVFAGTETGIFRSTNGGRAWREIELPCGFEAVLCLALSPAFARDATLYAGTETQGLWRSTDAGATWQRLPLETGEDPVNAVLAFEGDLLAATGSGLFRSVDGGQTWTRALPQYQGGSDITAFAAPQGCAPGSLVLCGFGDGEIQVAMVQ